MKPTYKKIIIIIFGIILIIIDQIIKSLIYNKLYGKSIVVIKNILNFTYVENTGIAFGLLQNNKIIFIAMTIIILLIVLIIFIYLLKKEINSIKIYAIVSILAGRNWKFN